MKIEPTDQRDERLIFQLVELNNQRRLLHELTDDVNQNVSKAQILFELCKSIGSSPLLNLFQGRRASASRLSFSGGGRWFQSLFGR